jgi:hypothetical protein
LRFSRAARNSCIPALRLDPREYKSLEQPGNREGESTVDAFDLAIFKG